MKPIVLKNRWGKVSIYQLKRSNGSVFYCVAWREGKHRQREYKTDLTDAKVFAANTLATISEGKSALEDAKKGELLPFYMKQAELQELGVTLDEIIKFYKKHALKPTAAVPTVQEASKEYQEMLEEQGLSLVHRRTVKYHLIPFEDAFRCRMNEVTSEGVGDYLAKVKVTPRTKNNYRLTLSAFFNWAMDARKMVDHNPVKGTRAYKVVREEPEVFTPEEMETLLKLVKGSEILPFVVIGGFAGVRAAEIRRLTWEDVDWEQKCIHLVGRITKTGRRRTALLCDNLMAWLEPFKNHTGKIVRVGDPNRVIRRLCNNELQWKQNALRHSYITYAMAIQRDAAGVAEQSGNSEAEVQRSYKALTTKQEAEKWFAIMPS